ncbi:cupin domain-containing protein [Saccharothrix variisporea]|uniref:Quercetin dioxygenase-like cupin family protein n=1 Tax=Saccharothrix variisporea TaxID=543527 RepID=A0A495XJ81_9PSEU|nr:cupin domain-containing protein [Saccharothrix variisporea]RKT72553.1 quercetin dioxygenase-like cupin family protein [Saccharothrix variisporea]
MSYYTGSTGEISALWRPVADVETIDRPQSQARLVAPGSTTQGQFGLFEWNMKPRAGGPSAHYHKTFSESFYVISGTVRLFNGDKWVEARSGDFLYVPEGGIHAFRNDSDEDASMLILFAPGAPREEYFRELAEIGDSGRQLSAEEWTELYARHDQYQVPEA